MPNFWKDKSVWACNNRYYVDGKSIIVPNSIYEINNPDEIASQLQTAKGKNSSEAFIRYIGLFVQANRRRLAFLKDEAYQFIQHAADSFDPEQIVVSFSGGKDSTVTADLAIKALSNPSLVHIFGDTTLEFPSTSEYAERYRLFHPEAIFQIARNDDQNFYDVCDDIGPPARMMRWCCSMFKTGPITRIINSLYGSEQILTFYGIRKSESVSRSKYNRIEDSADAVKIKQQTVASPIFFWKDIEIWLYILAEGIDFNNAYRLGYDRVGCWCCPNNNIRAQFLSRIYMPEKAKAWRSFLLDFASRIGKLDPEAYVDTGKWKARQGGNGLPSANDVKIRFTNCTAEDHAKIYRLVRSFDDELVGMFTPFGRVAPELGKKLLKEVVVLDSRTNVPILSLQPFFQDGYDYAVKVASETSGKQLSQHCIRFDNIIRKHGDKLSEASIAVLRANLIVRILKFKTKDYEDVKTALMLCSGLAREDLDGELQLLENEYALLGFDEHAGCFDFMEDSRGAHEYKIKKKQLTASWKADFKAMFKTAKVLEIGEFSEPQETSFGTNHKILTNEWKFTQEVLLAEDLTEDLAYEYVAYWRTCKSAAVPKGRLIWVYINKDTSLEYVERLQKIAGIFEGIPIVILLLNDVDGRLASALTNYDILDRMPDSIRQAYERAYSDDFSQAEQILSNEFDNLRKHREHMGTNGITTMKKRLQVSLTEIFEQLYPQTISFNFDGLLTASNNFTGKGSTYFCQIVKMLLSNNVNYDTIHDFTSDVRSKITAVLMESSATSWRCISDACAIMPPTEEKARAVYEDVVTQLNTDKFYDCKAFFEKFCYPPYGLSEEVSTLMLSVILANYSYCVRISYHDTQNSITRWKNELIVKDKKINLALLKESRFILIDTDAVEAKFQQLFNRLNASTDIDEVIQLKFETEKYEADNGIPESLVVHFKLACSRFDAAEKAKKLWGENTGRVADELDEAEERGNVYNALTALEQIDDIPLNAIFNENGFSISEDYQNTLRSLSARARELVNLSFDSWLEGTIHCKSVEAMTQFEKHVNRCCEKLDKFGFGMFAMRLSAQGKAELAKKGEIRSRQELLSDGQKFIAAVKKISLKNYSDVCDMLAKAQDLLERLAKFEKSLGNDAKRLHAQLNEWTVKLNQAKQQIQADMMNIWDDLASAETFEDIESVIMCINAVLSYHISEKDIRDFEDLKTVLDAFAADMSALKAATSDRKQLTSVIEELRQKYSGAEIDFDVFTVLEDEVRIVTEEIDIKDAAWRSRYLTLGDKSRETIHTWRENTRVLPAFLTEETILAVEVLRIEADSLISKAMIDDVVFYFRKLNVEERIRCLNLLTSQQ